MQPMGAKRDGAASDNNEQQSNQAAVADSGAGAGAINGDQNKLRCAVIGILPPSAELYHHIAATISSIDDSSPPIQWRGEYSTVNDEENHNKLTLLMSAIYTEQTVTPEAIVEAVQIELRTRTNKCFSSTAAAAEDNNDCSSAELWAVSPAPFPLRPLQGYDSLIHIAPEHWQNDAPSVLREYGIVTQPNILDQSEIADLKQLVDEAIADVEDKLKKHRPEIEVGEDTFIFREIASRNLQRFDLRLDTVPRAHEMVERCIMRHDTIRKFLANTLGPLDDMDYDISVLYSRPGAVDQKWHSDGAHQDDAADAGFDEDGWKTKLSDPYAVCLFLPLIDLDGREDTRSSGLDRIGIVAYRDSAPLRN